MKTLFCGRKGRRCEPCAELCVPRGSWQTEVPTEGEPLLAKAFPEPNNRKVDGLTGSEPWGTEEKFQEIPKCIHSPVSTSTSLQLVQGIHPALHPKRDVVQPRSSAAAAVHCR